MIVSLSVFFIAGVVSTNKAFADEPGSVFLWGGYDDDGLFGTYAEEHGSPEYSTFGDAEEGLQKLKAGFEVDLAWPCQGEIARWVRAGVLEPLDTSRIDNWNDMFPEVRDLPSGIVDGQNYFAPIDWGDTTLFYMPDRVTWMNADNESFIWGYSYLNLLYGTSPTWLINQSYLNFNHTRLQDIHVTNGIIFFLLLGLLFSELKSISRSCTKSHY